MCCFNVISNTALPRVWVWTGWPSGIPSNLNDSVVGCKVGWYKPHKTWHYYLLVRYSFLKQFIWPKAFAKRSWRNRLLAAWTVLVTCFPLASFWPFFCYMPGVHFVYPQKYVLVAHPVTHQQRGSMSSAPGSALLLLLRWWMETEMVWWLRHHWTCVNRKAAKLEWLPKRLFGLSGMEDWASKGNNDTWWIDRVALSKISLSRFTFIIEHSTLRKLGISPVLLNLNHLQG